MNFKEISQYFDEVNLGKNYYISEKYIFSLDKNINEDEDVSYERLYKYSKENEIRGISKNTIYVHTDTFQSLFSELCMLSTIKHLDISSNYLSDYDITELFTGLPNLINLNYLNLSRNNLTDVKNTAFDSHKIMKNLKIIDLSHNSFFEQELGNFLRKLKNLCPNITSLILVNNNLGIKEDLIVEIEAFPKLKSLILMDNSFNNKCISDVLIKTLRGKNDLEQLVIRENILLDIKLSNFIGNLSKLSHLELNMKREMNSENIFSQLLSNLKNLTHLNLSNLSIDNNSLFYMKSHIKEMSKLSYLNLSFNNITKEGGYELSKILPNLTNLIYLNLSNNQLGSSNVEICSNMKFLNDLSFLILENNQINDESAKQLNYAIKILRKLRMLNLRNNIFNKNILNFTSKMLSDLYIIY